MTNLLATSSTDPFTTLHCGVWDVLENHLGFVGVVKMPNRIKFLGNRIEPTKDRLTNTDLPEVTVEPASSETLLDTTNQKLFVELDIAAKTDNQRLDTVAANGLGSAVFPVLWEIIRAMLGAEDALTQLEWSGDKFVSKVMLTSVKFSTGREDKVRGVIGWSATLRYRIRLNFGILAAGPDPV